MCFDVIYDVRDSSWASAQATLDVSLWNHKFTGEYLENSTYEEYLKHIRFVEFTL